jgi:TPR repeat protein
LLSGLSFPFRASRPPGVCIILFAAALADGQPPARCGQVPERDRRPEAVRSLQPAAEPMAAKRPRRAAPLPHAPPSAALLPLTDRSPAGGARDAGGALTDRVVDLEERLSAAIRRIEHLERAQRNAGGISHIRPSAVNLLFTVDRQPPGALLSRAPPQAPSTATPSYVPTTVSPDASTQRDAAVPPPRRGRCEAHGGPFLLSVQEQPPPLSQREAPASNANAEFAQPPAPRPHSRWEGGKRPNMQGVQPRSSMTQSAFARRVSPEAAFRAQSAEAQRLVELAVHKPKSALDALLQRASGSADAKVAAADLLRKGGGSWRPKEQQFPRDRSAAVRLVDEALALQPNCAAALNARGEMARDGLGCRKDVDDAVSFFERAVRAGSAEAQFLLGKLLACRAGAVVGNDAEARRLAVRAKHLLFEALERGEGRAAVVIGHLYEYRAEAKNAVVSSVFDSGCTGVAHERAALRMYERAAGLGAAEAINSIGTCHALGYAGLETSFERALDFFSRAFEEGSLNAADNAGLLFETGLDGRFPAERDVESAISWYRRGMRRGHAPSTVHLAQLCNDGWGGESGRAMAELYFVRARDFNREAEEEDKLVSADVHRGLTSLFLFQASVDSPNRAKWDQKLDDLCGPAVGGSRRVELASLLGSASVGEEAARFVVLNNIQVRAAKEALLDMFSPSAVDALLQVVGTAVQDLDEALAAGGGPGHEGTAEFARLVEILGKPQATKLRDARRLVTSSPFFGAGCGSAGSSGGDRGLPSRALPRVTAAPKLSRRGASDSTSTDVAPAIEVEQRRHHLPKRRAERGKRVVPIPKQGSGKSPAPAH